MPTSSPPIPRERLSVVCRQHHIRRLSLFGSVLRDDFGPESDIDILVEFETGHVPGFLRLHAIEQELSALLGGRKVDLVTPKSLSPRLRDRVLAEARPQYEGDDGVYVGHMLDAARKAHAKVTGITRAQFDADENVRLAVTRESDEAREARASIPWKAVVGMRHKVVHDYFGVDEDVVWDTARNELPPLIAVLTGTPGAT